MLAMNYKINNNNKTHYLPLVCLYPRLSQVKTAINVETFEHSKIRFPVSDEKPQLEEIQAADLSHAIPSRYNLDEFTARIDNM